MTMISGKDGQILVDESPLASVTRWSFETKVSGVSYASSATGGYRRKTKGVKEARGKCEFLLDADNPATDVLVAGSRVSLRLAIDAAHHFEADVILDEVRFEVDIDSGAAVGGSASFTTDGAWTAPEFA